jgi:hypothetical protein
MNRKLRAAIFVVSLAGSQAIVIACGSSGAGGGGTPDSGEDSPAGAVDTGASSDTGAASETSSGSDTGTAGDTGASEDAGSNEDAGDAADSSDGAWVTAAHPTLPIVENLGGPVLTNMVATAVTFGDTYTNKVSDLDAFIDTVGSQPWWSATTSQYAVNAFTTAPPIQLTELAGTVLSDSEIQTWLANKVQTGAPGFADATSSDLFVLFYASTTTIFDGSSASEDAGGAQSCVAFGAYHSAAPVTSEDGGAFYLSYAVVPECVPTAAELDAGATPLLSETTLAASHEMVEAATDPEPDQAPAWLGTITAIEDRLYTDPWAAWSMSILGSWGELELADMCEGFASSLLNPPGFAYTVQRTWSNAAVRSLSMDPCAPYQNGEVAYFLAQPVFDPNFAQDEAAIPPVYLPEVTFTNPYGIITRTQGVTIPVGQSATIPLVLWSQAPIADPWTVDVYDPFVGPPPAVSPNLTFSLDKTTGNNGDVLHLTITSVAVDATFGGHPFVVRSYDGVLHHSTFGFVSQE